MIARELYIGLDVHERESQLAIFEKDGRLIEERSVLTKRLPRFLSSLPAERKHVGMESVGFTYPVFDALKEAGCDVSVCNPNTIMERARSKIKNDQVDAITLGDLLRTNYFPRSHIPDEETREKRLLTKERVAYGVRQAGGAEDLDKMDAEAKGNSDQEASEHSGKRAAALASPA